MDNTKFTLFNLLNDISLDWLESEKNTKGSIIGNLFKTIERKGKLRDAQISAIRIYLWLKEIGSNRKLSNLIKSGDIFINDKMTFYPRDIDYIEKPAKRYLNRYLQDSKVKNIDEFLDANLTYDKYEDFVEDLFEDFDYPNYLFSLPMGAGKTFLMSIFMYIDLYMYSKTEASQKYARNFIVLAPSARKTAILPALQTIKLFNPNWILPENDARSIKRNLKIEVLDEIAKSDKLQNQNPNLAKIIRTTNGHPYGNVFILNAEKVIPSSNVSEEDFNNLSIQQQTKINRANAIKEALANLKNIEVFLDEAHHSYSSDTETKKLREQLNVINNNKNIMACIGMSGTPYVNRKVKFNNKLIKIQDIQDIVYYYPLTDAIGNFLKVPEIRKVTSNEELLITSALDEFFEDFDINYENDTKSKIAFYCPSIEKLNNEILPIIFSWYDEHKRNKKEILRYYTNPSNSEYQLPSSNLVDFLNLDNPSSEYRVILLVAVGTEGWDCKSLTSVVLPRQKTSKNFVLQTTCRCLREVVEASKERALIYLDSSNYETLDNELDSNYHIHINDITNKENDFKDYPVYQRVNVGRILYKNVFEKYIEIETVNSDNKDYRKTLKKYEFSKFKESHPFINQIGKTKISENGLNNNLIYIDNKEVEYSYSFNDFIYELEKSSLGLVSCAEMIDYKKELNEIYKEIIEPDNMSWIVNHPEISTYDICKDITKIFANNIECHKETITEDVEINLLDWNLDNKPVIRVTENKKNNVYPENAYDDIEVGDEYYEDNIKELKRRYEDKLRIPNKEKSFNYLPYRMDSSYEFNFLDKTLRNLTDKNMEVYYNGYKNEDLNSLKIITPYGKYTPDFVFIRRDKENNIEKIMLIETKAEPFLNLAKENFVKGKFKEYNENYSYIRIGNIEEDPNEYNKMVEVIKKFVE